MAMTPEALRIFTKAEAQAEWLIGALRLIISSALGTVLFVTVVLSDLPVSDVLGRQLIYATMTMASYFILGLCIMTLIWTGAFRRWMTWPSALIDCVFILLGTWLSLSNMGLSGAYISAFPTIWLIPVVLACGALRFNPALLASMSVVLVAGFWAILQAPFLAPEDEARAALAFLYAGPPNLVRTVMIALAASVLVLASMRIRALLRRSIAETEARGRLTRFLPAQLDVQLERDGLDTLRKGAEQVMAVMFVDIRDFTRRSETLAPAELSAFLERYRSCVSEAARPQGGIVDKFVGDGALVVFDEAQGGAATRAVACARDILARVAAWRSDVAIGVGVHIGPVFAGVVGDEGRLEFTVLGDVVNVAARLEAATKDQGAAVIVSDTVMAATGGASEGWRAVPDLALRGRDAPISVWALDPV